MSPESRFSFEPPTSSAGSRERTDMYLPEIGTFVRLIEKGARIVDAPIGTVLKVSIHGFGYFGAITAKGEQGWLWPSEVEPWTPQVGDQVTVKPGAYDHRLPDGRINSETSEMHAGRVGTVTSVDTDEVTVIYLNGFRLDEGGYCTHSPDAVVPRGFAPERTQPTPRIDHILDAFDEMNQAVAKVRALLVEMAAR